VGIAGQAGRGTPLHAGFGHVNAAGGVVAAISRGAAPRPDQRWTPAGCRGNIPMVLPVRGGSRWAEENRGTRNDPRPGGEECGDRLVAPVSAAWWIEVRVLGNPGNRSM
jgi:hypothetical protein